MIFPKLIGATVGYVNLDAESREWIKNKGLSIDSHPPLDPVICQEMVDDIHKKYGIDFSYGGWFEDRSFLWAGSYLDEFDTYTHLGVDVNAPFDTEVAIDFDGSVVLVGNDYPFIGGWGNFVVFKHLDLPIHFIYAHLDNRILCKTGNIVKSGEIFARIGKAPHNGNWFSHVHVQTIDSSYFNKIIEKNIVLDGLGGIDGYGDIKDIKKNAHIFQDPLPYLLLR